MLPSVLLDAHLMHQLQGNAKHGREDLEHEMERVDHQLAASEQGGHLDKQKALTRIQKFIPCCSKPGAVTWLGRSDRD